MLCCRGTLTVVVGTLSLGITSCSNQQTIESATKFGAMVDSYEGAAGKLSQDIYYSCIRKTRYFSLNTLSSQEK